MSHAGRRRTCRLFKLADHAAEGGRGDGQVSSPPAADNALADELKSMRQEVRMVKLKDVN